MKKTFKLLALLPLFCGLLLAAACNKDNKKNPFVGTWRYVENSRKYTILTFNTDMTYIATNYYTGYVPDVLTGAYSRNEKSKTLTLTPGTGSSVPTTYTYFFAGNTLTLDDGDERAVYVKE
jgi:hypothetical protein